MPPLGQYRRVMAPSILTRLVPRTDIDALNIPATCEAIYLRSSRLQPSQYQRIVQTSASLIGGYDSRLRVGPAFAPLARLPLSSASQTWGSRVVHYGQLSRPHDSAFIRAEGLVCEIVLPGVR
jgi:hypothetical protein